MANKSIEQAKSSMESKEYDKAILSLEMALDEDRDNEEAKKLYDIVDEYQKSKKAIKGNNIDEAKKVLDAINTEYTSYSIKEDIDNLKSEVENHYKEIEKVKIVDEEKNLVDEENKLVKSKKTEYIEKLNSIESELSDLDYLYKYGTMLEMKDGAGKTYTRWDDALNEIYSVLKGQFSTRHTCTLDSFICFIQRLHINNSVYK